MKLLRFILRYWYVVACCAMSFAFYLQATYQKKILLVTLQRKKEALQVAKERALAEREQLQLRLQSEEDPLFMELVLKERLGVVSEEEIKVLFR